MNIPVGMTPFYLQAGIDGLSLCYRDGAKAEYICYKEDALDDRQVVTFSPQEREFHAHTVYGKARLNEERRDLFVDTRPSWASPKPLEVPTESAGYMLLADNGTHIPRYTHDSYQGAVTEAKRLHEQIGGDVTILSIVARYVDVPIQQSQMQLLTGESANKDNLPF